MCGNGARCFARFAAHLEAGGNGDSRAREHVSFETMAGIIRAKVEGETVTLDMSEPHDGADLGELTAAGQTVRALFINTGVPHVVVPVAAVAGVDVRGLGAALRYHERFAPKGTNANFYEVVGPREIRLRTYERGVEDETLACGTGATAAALVFAELSGLTEGPVTVRVKEGDRLFIGFRRTGALAFENVTLGGPADEAFRGEARLPVEELLKPGSKAQNGAADTPDAPEGNSPTEETWMDKLFEIQIDGPPDFSENWELYASGAKPFPKKTVR